MNYWRMQLHPNKPETSAKHAIESLSAGFIGLDFEGDYGDLTLTQDTKAWKRGEKDYLRFARDVAVGDRVLIIAHHFPLATAVVAGGYNYIKHPEPEIGVWFRHFRRVKDVKYYADEKTNAGAWRQVRMTDTISILKDKSSKSYRLIEAWP